MFSLLFVDRAAHQDDLQRGRCVLPRILTLLRKVKHKPPGLRQRNPCIDKDIYHNGSVNYPVERDGPRESPRGAPLRSSANPSGWKPLPPRRPPPSPILGTFAHQADRNLFLFTRVSDW